MGSEEQPARATPARQQAASCLARLLAAEVDL